MCKALGVPIAEHKRDGPTTCLAYLGIEVDTEAGQLRLHGDKPKRIRALLQQWRARRTCTRKELESLIGLLNHACKVVRSGRSFLRRKIDLLHAVITPPPPNSPLPIRLNREFQADLHWWNLFLEKWNGVSFLLPPAHLPRVRMTSHASGSWGCGAWHGSACFLVQWDDRSQPLTIAEKELIPIVLGCTAWGQSWSGHRVECFCDNQVVISCFRPWHKGLMHLLCFLVYVEARFSFAIVPLYINTKANVLADELSHNNLAYFLSKVPEADPNPTPVSAQLLDLLLEQQAD